MTLFRIFRESPLAGMTFLCCCVTLYLAIRLVGRMKWSGDRFLVGFIGLVCVQQCVRVLKDVGVLTLPFYSLENLVNLLVSVLFLFALMVARTQASESHQNRMLLRLVQAKAARLASDRTYEEQPEDKTSVLRDPLPDGETTTDELRALNTHVDALRNASNAGLPS